MKGLPYPYDEDPDAVYIFNTTTLEIVNVITSFTDDDGKEFELHGPRLVDVTDDNTRAYVTLGGGITGGEGSCSAVLVIDMQQGSETFGEAIDLIRLVTEGTIDCPGDCDGNGELNILDFVCFQAEWTNQTPFGDCDGNGQYNILDFVCYQGLFQQGCN